VEFSYIKSSAVLKDPIIKILVTLQTSFFCSNIGAQLPWMKKTQKLHTHIEAYFTRMTANDPKRTFFNNYY